MIKLASINIRICKGSRKEAKEVWYTVVKENHRLPEEKIFYKQI